MKKSNKMIPHNKPALGKEEIKAVKRVISSNWIAQGREVELFENEFCRFLDWEPGHAAAVSSGTAALFLALWSLAVEEDDDEVILPTYVCSAVLNSIYLTGAKPVLADINPGDLNISYEEAARKINKKTKAIIVPHIYGRPADLDKFLKLRLPVIEDCAQAIGSKYKKKHVGTYGKLSIFSFYASKMITTGYGGMIFSKDKKIIKKIKDFREFDCRKNYYPRFNFQLSDMQAAIGREQLKKLPAMLDKRKSIAEAYLKILPRENIWLTDETDKTSNYFRFLIRCEHPQKLKNYLEKQGIKTILPIEKRELLHRYLKQNPSDFPASEKAAGTVLSLPIFPSLSRAETEKIKKALDNYFKLKI